MAKSRTGISEYMKIRRYVVDLVSRTEGDSVRLPSLNELSKKFGVSIPTVCKAMKALNADGYVVGKKGLGSFTNSGYRLWCSTPLHFSKNFIAIIIGDGMHSFYGMYDARILSRTMEYLTSFPAFVMILELSSTSPDDIYGDIQNARPDAVFWYAPPERLYPVCHRLIKEKFPVVFGGQHFDGAPCIDFAFEDAAYRCGRMLIKEGRRNIVFFPDIYPWTHESGGLCRAYEEAGIKLNKKLFFKKIYDVHEKILEMFSYGVPVDAIYGHMQQNGVIAEYLLKQAPEKLKQCSLVDPGISSLRKDFPVRTYRYLEPFDDYGKGVAELLRRRMDDPSYNEHRLLDMKITVSQ